MSQWPLWAVLTPGEPAWLESRARAIVMTEEDGKEPPFEFIRGTGHYHVIVSTGLDYMGAEMRLAKALSLECDEPVYSIERASDPWTVMSWRKGTVEVLEVGPEPLARFLGCPLPGSEVSDSPARTPLRKAALVEGVLVEEAYRALEEEDGSPLPAYHIEDTPRGLLLADGAVDMGFADLTLSEKFPHATVYAVIASPSLDIFFVNVRRGGAYIAQFTRPLDEFPSAPEVSEIKGERSPERILAALGIPVEWFLNE